MFSISNTKYKTGKFITQLTLRVVKSGWNSDSRLPAVVIFHWCECTNANIYKSKYIPAPQVSRGKE